jgi:hypothetical protein
MSNTVNGGNAKAEHACVHQCALPGSMLRPCASGSAGLESGALRPPFCFEIPSLEISDDDQIYR